MRQRLRLVRQRLWIVRQRLRFLRSGGDLLRSERLHLRLLLVWQLRQCLLSLWLLIVR